jgi:hypothetical protein
MGVQLILGAFCLFAAADVPHPLLSPIHANLDDAYAAGAAQCGKLDEERMLGRFRQDLGHVRGRHGWQPTQANLRSSMVDAYLRGYVDGPDRAAQGLARDDAVIRDFRSDYRDQIEFIVDVRAWPGVDFWRAEINRPARAEDVEQVTYLLRTQDGRIIEPVAGPSQSPTEVTVIERVEGHVDPGTRRIDGATYFLPRGTGSEPEFVCTRVQAWQAYYSEHRVWFPIRDSAGRPIATREQPRLTLIMTRGHGDLEATFDLDSVYQGVSVSR